MKLSKSSCCFNRQLTALAGWLALSVIVAAIGGAASAQAGPFYSQLNRPGWSPPGWLFGPVWTVLYALMGVAAWLIWRSEAGSPEARPEARPEVRRALGLYLVHLVPNALWSWLFFAWQWGALSFANIILLWAMILATIISFSKIKPLAGALLIPYLLWVSFAALLNYSLWQLNPGLLR